MAVYVSKVVRCVKCHSQQSSIWHKEGLEHFICHTCHLQRINLDTCCRCFKYLKSVWHCVDENSCICNDCYMLEIDGNSKSNYSSKLTRRKSNGKKNIFKKSKVSNRCKNVMSPHFWEKRWSVRARTITSSKKETVIQGKSRRSLVFKNKKSGKDSSNSC